MYQAITIKEAVQQTFNTVLKELNGEYSPEILTGFPEMDKHLPQPSQGTLSIISSNGDAEAGIMAIKVIKNHLQHTPAVPILYCSQQSIMIATSELLQELSAINVTDIPENMAQKLDGLTEIVEHIRDYPLYMLPAADMQNACFYQRVKKAYEEKKFELLIAQNHQTAVAVNLCDLALELNIPVLLITGESNPKELKKARFYASRIIQIKSTEKEIIIKNVT